jgi:hypothetical protein
VFAKIVAPVIKNMQFKMEIKDQHALTENLWIYAQDLLHFEGYTMYTLDEFCDMTDEDQEIELDDGDELEDGHCYELRLSPNPDATFSVSF